MAWLHATPAKKKESRQQSYRRDHGDDCPELALPPIENVEHVIAHLFEVGPAVRGEEITHGDLRDFQENTGAVLCEFEASMLISLSRAYLAMLREASGEKVVPAPYRRERTQEERMERDRLMIESRKARQRKGKP